jgi:hypothetical protein
VDLFLATSQGAGLGLATGMRPFLVPLLVGVLARGDLGVDFEGSGYGFLESIPFLAAMLVAVAASRVVAGRASQSAVTAVALGSALVLGALEFAGSLAEEGYAPEPGIGAGAVCALIGALAVVRVLAGAQSRLVARDERESSSYLTLYADAGALLLAALSVLVSPIAWPALLFCAWLLIERRRRAARKYEGLRVLR